jgi:hypothetical protein
MLLKDSHVSEVPQGGLHAARGHPQHHPHPVLSGTFDAVTAPRQARIAAQTLPERPYSVGAGFAANQLGDRTMVD